MKIGGLLRSSAMKVLTSAAAIGCGSNDPRHASGVEHGGASTAPDLGGQIAGGAGISAPSRGGMAGSPAVEAGNIATGEVGGESIVGRGTFSRGGAVASSGQGGLAGAGGAAAGGGGRVGQSGADRDADGVADSADNCPSTKNPGQQDADGNAVGDACEGIGDFLPAFELLEHDPESSFPGVTLLSVMGGPTTFDDPSYADFGYLAALPLAANGSSESEFVPLWVYSDFWGGAFSSVDVLPNSHLVAIRGADAGERLVEIDPVSGETVWTYDDVMVNHSFQRLDNGDFIFIHTTLVEHETYGQDVDNDGVLEVRMDGVRVIDPDKNTLWDWSLLDHDIDLEEPPPSPIYSTVSDYWSNCNAVKFVPAQGWTQSDPLEGSVYLNCRLMDRLYKIDYPSGQIDWVMGSGGDFGEGFFHHPHDPNISHVEDAEGSRIATRILLYDNREAPPLGGAEPCPPDETCPPEIEPYSRVIEVQVDNDLNAEIIWKWPSPTSPDFDAVKVYSPLAGGVQRLPNGNILITHATEGGNPFLGEVCSGHLMEVLPDGTLTGGRIVWDVTLASSYCTFKATRIPPDAVEGWASYVEEAP